MRLRKFLQQKRSFFFSAFVLGSTLWAAVAHAAGLGNLSVYSFLGQSLSGEIKLIATPDELAGLSAKVASPEAFERAGITYSSAANKIIASIAKRRDGVVVVQLSSSSPINDPYVELLVELSWPQGSVVRQFTFLLDPSDTASKGAPEIYNEYNPAVPEEKPQEPALNKQSQAVTPEGSVAESATVDVAPADKEKSAAEGEAAAESGEVAKKPEAEVHAVAESEKTSKKGSKSRSRGGKKSDVGGEESNTGERTVESGDTLYSIASKIATDGVSLDQIVAALYQANKKQFINGNMNLIWAGKVLTIPSESSMTAISAKEARRIIQAQTADFSSYRNDLAASPLDVVSKASTSSMSGKIDARLNNRQSQLKLDGDHLQVAQTTLGKTASPAALREELISKDRALQEANSRIKDLEKTVEDQKRLLNLQQGGGATNTTKPGIPVPAHPPVTGATPAPTTPLPASGTTSSANAAGTPAPAVNAPSGTTPPSVVPGATADGASSTPATPPVQPKPKPKTPPPPPPGLFDSLFGSNLIYGGVAALIVALLGYFGLRFYRNRSSAQSTGQLADVDVEEISHRSKKSYKSAKKEAAKDKQPAADEDLMDPLAEAESYMAFGRDEQAIEVLQEALDKEPRSDLQLKLLELFAKQHDKDRFNSLAMDVRTTTQGQGTQWQSVVALGKSLDPTNTLYGAKPSTLSTASSSPSSPPAVAAVAATVVVAPVMAAAPMEFTAREDKPLDAVTTTFSTPGEMARMAEKADNLHPQGLVTDTMVGIKMSSTEPLIAQQPLAEPPLAEQEENSEAFDLDFQSTPGLSGIDDSFDLNLTTQAQNKEEDVDLDLASRAGLIEDHANDGPQGEVFDLDFDSISKGLLDEPAADVDLDITSAAGVEITPSHAGVSKLTTAAKETAAPAKNSLDLEASSGMLLPDISLDLDAPVKEKTPSTLMESLDLNKSEAPLLEKNLEAPAQEPLTLSIGNLPKADNSVTNTKIDLAKAYEAMGNLEGAKELLEEVVKEGSADHQQLARSLLGKLG